MRTFLNPVHFLSLLAAFVLVLIPVAHAEEGLTVAAGAGYRRLIDKLCNAYTARSGGPVNKVFGNMGQITTQARESGTVDFIVGDKQFLDAAKLAFADELTIGQGKLVAAVAKGIPLRDLNALTNAAIKRIAIADQEKAIYGRAAREFLTNKGIWQQIEPKLLVVGTVPQVTAYVLTGEVDVGFINLTEALTIRDKVETIIPIDDTLYSPILLVVKRLQQDTYTMAAVSFMEFLQSEEIKKILTQQGP